MIWYLLYDYDAHVVPLGAIPEHWSAAMRYELYACSITLKITWIFLFFFFKKAFFVLWFHQTNGKVAITYTTLRLPFLLSGVFFKIHQESHGTDPIGKYLFVRWVREPACNWKLDFEASVRPSMRPLRLENMRRGGGIFVYTFKNIVLSPVQSVQQTVCSKPKHTIEVSGIKLYCGVKILLYSFFVSSSTSHSLMLEMSNISTNYRISVDNY